MEKAKEIKTNQQLKDIPIGTLIIRKDKRLGLLLIGVKTEECKKECGYMVCKIKNAFTSNECTTNFHRIVKMCFCPDREFVYYKENNEYKHMYRALKRKLYQTFKKSKHEQIIGILKGFLNI